MKIFEIEAEASERLNEYCERLSFRYKSLADFNPEQIGNFKIIGQFNGIKFELDKHKTSNELVCYYNNFADYYNKRRC